MTDKLAIVQRALQNIGTRTTITQNDLDTNGSNEAIQANIIYDNTRDDLLRMAPWNCAFNTQQLVYITSVPGTPENTSAPTAIWQKGQPAPPWAYEYQYPVDCLRACFITPQTATGYASGIPITTAVTGGAPSFWQGPPVKYKVAIDKFYPVTSAVVASGGQGYLAGDLIVVELLPSTATIINKLGTFNAEQPQGAAVVLRVVSAPLGIISTVEVVNIVPDSDPTFGGSYFYTYSQAGGTDVAQASTTGAGTGATFQLTFGDPRDQRVILTNQEFALLNYIKQVTDENLFDTLFQTALTNVLGAQLCMALTGDKGLANLQIGQANEAIRQARAADGNEGLTINDVMPDWLRVRGIWATEGYSGPYNTGFDYGPSWPMWA